MSRSARTDSCKCDSSPWRRSLPGIAFSRFEVANYSVFVDVHFKRVTSLITDLMDFIPEDQNQNQNQNRLMLIYGLQLLLSSSSVLPHATKVSYLEAVKTMLSSSGDHERAIETFDKLMEYLEEVLVDPGQVASLIQWLKDLPPPFVGAPIPRPPSQEDRGSDESAAAPDGSPNRVSVHSSLSSHSHRLPEHHENDAQESESVIFYEERSGSGLSFAGEPGEESAGGVSVSGIIFQQRSTDATEAESVTQDDMP